MPLPCIYFPAFSGQRLLNVWPCQGFDSLAAYLQTFFADDAKTFPYFGRSTPLIFVAGVMIPETIRCDIPHLEGP